MAGVEARYTCLTPGGIPGQWQRFSPHIGSIAGQIGDEAYGVSYDFDGEGGYSYICGVAVAETAEVPGELSTIMVYDRLYAVFTHADHVAGVPGTYATIWNEWLPRAGVIAAAAPAFERYTARFDAGTGRGSVEIWVPIEEDDRS